MELQILEDSQNYYIIHKIAKEYKSREEFERNISEKVKNYKDIPERLKAMYLECIKLEYFMKTGEILSFSFIGNLDNEEIVIERSL